MLQKIDETGSFTFENCIRDLFSHCFLAQVCTLQFLQLYCSRTVAPFEDDINIGKEFLFGMKEQAALGPGPFPSRMHIVIRWCSH